MVLVVAIESGIESGIENGSESGIGGTIRPTGHRCVQMRVVRRLAGLFLPFVAVGSRDTVWTILVLEIWVLVVPVSIQRVLVEGIAVKRVRSR